MYRAMNFCGSNGKWIEAELTVTDSNKIKILIKYVNGDGKEIPIISKDDWEKLGPLVLQLCHR